MISYVFLVCLKITFYIIMYEFIISTLYKQDEFHFMSETI